MKSIPLHKMYHRIISKDGSNNVRPAVCIDENTRVFVAWTSGHSKSDKDDIYVTYSLGDKSGENKVMRPTILYGDTNFSEPEKVNSYCSVNFVPDLTSSSDGKLWICWAGKDRKGWSIHVRCKEKGSWLEEEIISKRQTSACSPHIATDNRGNIFCVWESYRGKNQSILVRYFDSEIWSKPMHVTEGDDFNFRPSIAFDSQERMYIVWDSFRKGVYSVYMRYFQDGIWSEVHEIPGSRNQDRYHPHITVDKEDRLWIIYAKSKNMVDNSVSTLRWANSGSVSSRPSIHVTLWDRGGWFSLSNISRSSEQVAEEGHFPLITSTPEGKIWVFWQVLRRHMDWTFHGKIFDKGEWSEPIRLEGAKEFDQWGSTATDKEGNVWFVCESGRVFEDRKIILQCIAHDIFDHQSVYTHLSAKKDEKENVHQGRPIEYAGEGKQVFAFFKPKTIQTENGKYQLFWGNLHVQTILSDGHCGTPDQYFTFARERYHWDFAAVTDHCDSVKWLACEWAYLQRVTNMFNRPGEFITISGFEWTQGDYGKVRYGHRCIIYPTDDQPFFSPLTEEAHRQGDLLNLLKKTNGLMFAHHITRVWSGGTKWDKLDEKVEPCIEICSHWGRFEYYHNFGHITAGEEVRGCSVQEILAKGHKLGFIGGSDSHELCHQKNDGTTLMYLPSLTRKSIFEALKKRRVYASTGIKIYIDLRVDGHLMGEEYTTVEYPRIFVQVKSVDTLEEISIIRNNKDIFSRSCSEKCEKFWYIDKEIEKGKNYYYLRTTQKDKNRAWSSPVWVRYIK